MVDMTVLHMWYMTHSYVWCDSFMCETWLIHICAMAHSNMCHKSFICVPWLIHMCAMTNLRVCHGSFMRAMTNLHVCHDSFMHAMTNLHVCHDSFIVAPGFIEISHIPYPISHIPYPTSHMNPGAIHWNVCYECFRCALWFDADTVRAKYLMCKRAIHVCQRDLYLRKRRCDLKLTQKLSVWVSASGVSVSGVSTCVYVF